MGRARSGEERVPRGKASYLQVICKSDYLSQGKELVNITPGHFESPREFENGGMYLGGVYQWVVYLFPGEAKMEMGLFFHYIGCWSVRLFIHLCP